MQNQIDIIPSTKADLATIFKFYELAIEHQKKVFHQHWQGFDKELIKQEIKENRQFKILVNGQLASIFAITFNDPEIWQERDLQASIYIHRIVTHPNFRGYSAVKQIIKWGITFAKKNQIQFLRMDTWADNLKLLEYYTNCGFTHVGSITIPLDSGLPKHYEGISLNLFEITV
jgi:ribosomal protein S18 acetylase RimI-like enzyme